MDESEVKVEGEEEVIAPTEDETANDSAGSEETGALTDPESAEPAAE